YVLLAGIAALLLAIGTAHAAEIPKQYHGEWCSTKWDTIYKRCAQGDLIIDRTGWGWEDNSCEVLTVRNSKYGGNRLQALCSTVDLKNSERRIEARWWLGSNGTRLQTIETRARTHKFAFCKRGSVNVP